MQSLKEICGVRFLFFLNSESGGFTLLGVLLEAAVIVAFERLFVSGNSCSPGSELEALVGCDRDLYIYILSGL